MIIISTMGEDKGASRLSQYPQDIVNDLQDAATNGTGSGSET